MWWNCPGLDRACMGGQQFLLREGWNTYNIAVTNGGFGLPQEWTGPMTGLRLAISPPQQVDVSIDWMRAYQPSITSSAPAPADYFADDETSAHRASIDKAAGAGVTGGTAENLYSPDLTVRRDQMASFLVRLLDLLVASGKGSAPAR